MGKGSSGTNTVTQNSAPPQAYQDAYSVANQNAASAASIGYTPYGGQLVAGQSPDQSAAYSTIANSQGSTTPFYNTASNLVGQGANTANSTAQAADPYFSQEASAGQGGYSGLAAASPFYNAASTETAQGSAPISSSAIQGYENPYQSQVIGATTAEINQQNQIQQEGVLGNAESQGALGGDRTGIVQSALTNQQDLAENSTIAGLNQSNYNQALTAAQADASRQIQGGYLYSGLGSNVAGSNLSAAQLASQSAGAAGTNTLAEGQLASGADLNAASGFTGLGTAAQSSALTGASAQLQSGQLQQQQQQNQINAAYQQYALGQQYPFQDSQYYANIAEQLGSLSGGTSNTTSPGPSTASQIAGLGMAGVGVGGLAYNAYNAANAGGAGAGSGAGASTAFNTAAMSSDAGLTDAALAYGTTDAAAAYGASDALAAASAVGGLYRSGGRVARASGGIAAPQLSASGTSAYVPQLPTPEQAGLGMLGQPAAAPSGMTIPAGPAPVQPIRLSDYVPPPQPTVVPQQQSGLAYTPSYTQAPPQQTQSGINLGPPVVAPQLQTVAPPTNYAGSQANYAASTNIQPYTQPAWSFTSQLPAPAVAPSQQFPGTPSENTVVAPTVEANGGNARGGRIGFDTGGQASTPYTLASIPNVYSYIPTGQSGGSRGSGPPHAPNVAPVQPTPLQTIAPGLTMLQSILKPSNSAPTQPTPLQTLAPDYSMSQGILNPGQQPQPAASSVYRMGGRVRRDDGGPATADPSQYLSPQTTVIPTPQAGLAGVGDAPGMAAAAIAAPGGQYGATHHRPAIQVDPRTLMDTGPGQPMMTTPQLLQQMGGVGVGSAPNPLAAQPPQQAAAPIDVTPAPQPQAGLAGAGQPSAVPPGFAGAQMQAESSMDPNATNSRSSSAGLGGFISGTWLDQIKRNFPDVAQGKSDQQILALRNDPNLTRAAINSYTGENSQALQRQGLPADGATMSVAYRFGAGGAAALLKADPGQPASSVLGPEVMSANPDLAGRTVGDVITATGARMKAQQPGAQYAGLGNVANDASALPAPANSNATPMQQVAGLGNIQAPQIGYTQPAEGVRGLDMSSPWMALLQAGLATAAGTNPHALVNIGAGGLAGLQYAAQQQQYQRELAQQKNQVATTNVGLQFRGQLANQQGQIAQANIQQRAQELAQQAKQFGLKFGLESAIAAPTTALGAARNQAMGIGAAGAPSASPSALPSTPQAGVATAPQPSSAALAPSGGDAQGAAPTIDVSGGSSQPSPQPSAPPSPPQPPPNDTAGWQPAVRMRDGTVLPAQNLYDRRAALQGYLGQQKLSYAPELAGPAQSMLDDVGKQIASGKGLTPSGGVVALPGEQQMAADQSFQNKFAEGQGTQAVSVTQAASTAAQVHQRVSELQDASQGFRPGATGSLRADASARIVDAYQALGQTPPVWATQMATNADVIGKIGGQMTADLVRTLGTREAAAVYQQVKQFNPNVSMTSGGFDTVLRSIDQGAYRTEDLSNFQNNWLKNHPNTTGMQAAFDKAQPPALYASRVMPRPAPAAEQRQPGFYYTNPSGATGMWTGQGWQPVTRQ